MTTKQEKCAFCGELGIHECHYNEDAILKHLEEDFKKSKAKPAKKVSKPHYSANSNSRRLPQRRPMIGRSCKNCGASKQTCDGLCLDCTRKQQEESLS